MSVKLVLEGIKPSEKLIKDTEKLLKSKITQKKRIQLSKLIAAAACLSIIIGALSFSLYVYNRPVHYISIDVNPSLELEINRFSRVIKVNYFNNDARNLVSEKELCSLKIAQAINLVMNEINNKGYLSSGKISIITIATYSNKLDESIKILNESKNIIDNGYKSLNVIYYTVSSDLKKEANLLALSFGKLNLIKIIQQLDKSATVEDLKDASITSIINEIYYLTSDENTDVDDETKENIKKYIESIQTKEDAGVKIGNKIDIKDSTEITTDQKTDNLQKEPDDTPSISTSAKAVSTKAAAVAEKTEFEAEKAHVEAEAKKAQAEAKAEKVRVDAEAEKTRAEAEAEKARAEAEAEKARAEAEAEKVRAEAEAEKARAEAEAEKARVEAEAEKARAEAEAEKARVEAEAEKARAEAEAEK